PASRTAVDGMGSAASCHPPRTEPSKSGTSFTITKLIGESSGGIEDAVRTAPATSASKVHGQTWCHVTDIRANVNERGGVDRWQVQVDVAFKVDDA
ncbi:MAG: dodecin family protein, partial [Acidimicrobiales bacterium]|nr:dodecin family protein [Acidimicrobiales bacterium]